MNSSEAPPVDCRAIVAVLGYARTAKCKRNFCGKSTGIFAVNQAELLRSVHFPAPESDLAQELLKSPYDFSSLPRKEKYQEAKLKGALIEHIKDFLIELGKGFRLIRCTAGIGSLTPGPGTGTTTGSCRRKSPCRKILPA